MASPGVALTWFLSGNSNTGVCANRFFRRAEATAEILHLPHRFITACWVMLRQLSSTTKMINVAEYRRQARELFDMYVQVTSQASL